MPREAASGLRAALAAALCLEGPADVAAADAVAVTPVALAWSAPPECPQADAVQAWLAGYLGAAADPAGYPGVRTRGELTRVAAGWQLRLVIERDDATGERTVGGRDCAEVARSGALALAIALEPKVAPAPAPALVPDPAVVVPAPPDPVAAVTGTPSDASMVANAAAAPVVSSSIDRSGPPGPMAPEPMAPGPRPRLPRVAHALRLAAGAEAGLLPGVGGGVAAGYVLRLPWLRLELVGAYWPARRSGYADRPAIGATTALATVGLRVCPTVRLRQAHDGRGAPGLIELPMCAGLELGALAARGRGFDGARALVRPWLTVELQPTVVWRFARRLALWAGLAVVVPVRRPSFQVDPLPPLWQVGGVGLRTLLGLEWQPGRDPAQKK